MPILLLAGCPQGCQPERRVDRFDPSSTERFLDRLGKHRVATQTFEDSDGGESEAEVARDETAVVAISREPNTLSPILEPDVIARQIVVGNIYETLVRWGPDEHGVPGPLPGAIGAWSVDVTGKRLELQLRDGARWHDGRQVSSSDVQFTLDTLRSQESRSPHAVTFRHLLAIIERVDLVTPRKVRVVLHRPSTYALRVLAEVPLLPQHALTAAEVYQPGAYRRPLGSGPWRLVRWKKGIEVLLARAETYDLGRPGFPFLSFVVQPDGAQVITHAKQGDIDIITDVPPSYVPDQIASPAIATAFERVAVAPPRFLYLALNTRKGSLLDDVRVRRALAALVDRRSLVEVGYKNQAEPVATPVWPGGPVSGKPAPVPKPDLEFAKRQLEYASWFDSNRDGVRDKDGEKLTLRMLATDGRVTRALIDELQPAAREAGLLLTVARADAGFIAAKLKQGEFDLALIEYGAMADEDLGVLLDPGAPRNFGAVNDAELSAALEALRRAEPADRAQPAERLSRVMLDRVPIITLARPTHLMLVSRRVAKVTEAAGMLSLAEVSPR